MNETLLPACTVKRSDSEVEAQILKLTGGLDTTCFSISEDEKVPNLWNDKPVFKTPVVLVTNYWRITRDRKMKKEAATPVIENPTWKNILLAVEEIIAKGDKCAIFLEGFLKTGRTRKGAAVYEIVIGS